MVADSFYGRNHEFRDAVNACIGATYFVSVPSDTLCRLREPVVEKKKYRYGGEVRSKKLLREKEKPPATVYEVRGHPGWNHHMLICMLARFFLRHLKIRLGEKSSIYYSVPGADPAGGCSAA